MTRRKLNTSALRSAMREKHLESASDLLVALHNTGGRMSYGAVRNWLEGKHTPNPSALFALCHILAIPLDDLAPYDIAEEGEQYDDD